MLDIVRDKSYRGESGFSAEGNYQNQETMKYFESYQELLPFLIGYKRLKKYRIFAPNSFRKNLCRFISDYGCFTYAYGIFFMGGCLIFKAENFKEYTDNAYFLATLLNDTFLYVSLRWRFKDIFRMIDKCEHIIEWRK